MVISGKVDRDDRGGSATRRAPGTRHRAIGLLTIGIGTGVIALSNTPVASADSAPAGTPDPAAASASTYTDVNTSASEAFLYNPGSVTQINDGINGSATAYGEWTVLGSDASNTFSQLYSTEVTFDSELFQDFTSFGQLVEGGIQDGTSIAAIAISAAKPAGAIPPGDLPPSESYSTPATTSTVDVDVNTDTTAAQFVTGIDNEAVIMTQSLINNSTSIQGLTSTETYGVNDQYEAEVAGDLVSFQKEINGAINDFPSLTAYEAGTSLDTYLKGLLTTELDLNQSAILLTEQLDNGSATGLASVNADLFAYATQEYDYVQDILNTVSTSDYLTSIGL